jgi:hypothetical protein
MNIARVFFGGLFVAALVAGCGDDKVSGSPGGSSPLSACAVGATSTDACQACFESKCAAQVETCWGKGYSGGECEYVTTCAKDAKDACGDCRRDNLCDSCLENELRPCAGVKCADECKDSVDIKGSCADLAVCCPIITVPSAKTGCEGIVADGNETTCHAYYPSIRPNCER